MRNDCLLLSDVARQASRHQDLKAYRGFAQIAPPAGGQLARRVVRCASVSGSCGQMGAMRDRGGGGWPVVVVLLSLGVQGPGGLEVEKGPCSSYPPDGPFRIMPLRDTVESSWLSVQAAIDPSATVASGLAS